MFSLRQFACNVSSPADFADATEEAGIGQIRPTLEREPRVSEDYTRGVPQSMPV